MTPREALSNRERIVTVANGWVMLPLLLVLVLGDIGLFIYSIAAGKAEMAETFAGMKREEKAEAARIKAEEKAADREFAEMLREKAGAQ